MHKLLLMFLMVVAPVFAELDPERLITLPATELPRLLQQGADRILLPEEEYRILHKRAMEAQTQQDGTAPSYSTPLRVDVVADLQDDHVRLEAVCLLEGLRPGLNRIRLDFEKVYWTEAELDGQPAKLAGKPGGVLEVFLEGRGEKTLRLNGISPLPLQRNRQILSFKVPDAPGQQILRVPEELDVEESLTKGKVMQARVAGFVVDPSDKEQIAVLPEKGWVTGSLQLDRLYRTDPRLISSQQLQQAVLDGRHESVTESLMVFIHHQPVSALELTVSPELQVRSLLSKVPLDWTQNEEDPGRVNIRFREDVIGPVLLEVKAIRQHDTTASWQPARIRVVDSSIERIVQRLSVRNPWSVSAVMNQDAELISSRRAAILSTLQDMPSPMPGESYTWSIQPNGEEPQVALTRKELELEAFANLLLSSRKLGNELRGTVTLLPRHTGLVETRFHLPVGWRVSAVHEQHAHEQVELPYDIKQLSEDLLEVRVTFPVVRSSGVPVRMTFTAEHTPEDWLETGGLDVFEFPSFTLPDADRVTGAVAVDAGAFHSIRVVELEGLTPLDDRSKQMLQFQSAANIPGYRFEASGFSLTLERLPASASARIQAFTFLRAREGGMLNARWEWLVDNTNAPLEVFVFELPWQLPQGVQPVVEHATLRGEIKRTPLETGGERWTLPIVGNVEETIRITLEGERPLEHGVVLELPLPRHPEQEVESGFLALEGLPDLNVELTHQARSVDPGELADASYQPGAQLIGTFAYAGKPLDGTVTFTPREKVEVMDTRIRRLEVETVVSVTGHTQNEAVFTLESAPPFLMLQLPGDGEAWSVVLDSEAVEPRRGAKQEWLIPVPSGREGLLRTVRIVYVGDVTAPGLFRNQHLQAPRLSVYAEDGGHTELTPLETRWWVTLPEGFRLVQSKGSAVLTTEAEPRLAMVEGVKRMIAFGGGFRMPFSWLTGALQRSARLTKEYAGDEAYLREEEQPLPGSEPEPLQVAPRDGLDSSLHQRIPQRQVDLWKGGKEKFAKDIALTRGFRSLQIQLNSKGGGLPFYGLSSEPTVEISMVRQSSLRLFGVALSVLVLLGGIRIWDRPARSKWVYLLSVFLLSCLPGVLPKLAPLDTVFNAAFTGGVLLMVLYVGLRIARFFWRFFSRPILFLLSLLVGLVAYGDGISQPDPLPLPENVMVKIAPVNPEDTVHFLVPRAHVESLQHLLDTHESSAETEHSALGWLGGHVKGHLEEGRELDVQAEYQFRLFGDEPQTILIPLSGAAAGSVQLDGQPARVRMVEKGLEVQVSGAGDHRLTLQLRTPVRHMQGRHSVTFRVLPVPGLVTEFTVGAKGTRVEFRGGKGVSWLHLTEEAGENVSVPVGSSGTVDLVWSEALPEHQQGGGMEVMADAGLHILPDRVMMEWQGQFVARGTPVDQVDLRIPDGWEVFRVDGRNVSGWERASDDRSTLQVHFLRETQREQVSVTLWQPRTGEEGVLDIQPVQVPAALRQTGQIEVHVAKTLTASVRSREGLRRAELMRSGKVSLQEATLGFSSIPTQPFQNFSYHSSEAALQVAVQSHETDLSTTWQQVLKLADQEDRVEARCILDVKGAPVHALTFVVEEGVQLERLAARGIVAWSQQGQDVVALAPSGLQGRVQIVMEGIVDMEEEASKIPSMQLVGAELISGSWVILADPSLEVSLQPGSEMKRIPLRDTHTWLEQNQRSFARLALLYGETGATADLRLRVLEPEVSVTTFHNLRVNHQVIEETLFIDAEVRRAGLETFSIRIPSRYRDAGIQTPLLREKRFREVPDQPEWVDLELTFQDKLMGQLVVLLERDRSAETDRVTLRKPIVLTGREHRAYLTVENAGRDELRIEQAKGVEALTRAHADWGTATELMGEHVTFAYVAGRDAADSVLDVVRVAREQARTAGARIGLSRIELQMDESASYIGRWTLWIDNRTEQLLHARLPSGARLVQIRVAGKEVVPVQVAQAQEFDLYIPLVKTARGEKDVRVQVIYAGDLEGFSNVRRRGFPFPESENIPVDLSQARLTLPNRYRWLRFNGTMRQLQSTNQLQAGWLSYQAGLTERLTQTLKSGDVFEKARAVHSLNAVSESLSQTSVSGQQGEGVIAEELARASRVLEEAQQEIVSQDKKDDGRNLSDNRMSFRGKFDAQANSYSRNQVFWNGSNFREENLDVTENDIELQTEIGGRQYEDIQSVVQSRDVFVTPDPVPGKSSGKKNQRTAPRTGLRRQASKYLENLNRKQEESVPAVREPRAALLFPQPDMSRMTTFAFSTPRGNTRVTALTVPEKWIEGLVRLLSFLLLLAVLQWIRKRPQQRRSRRKGWGKWMILIGLFGLVSGTLPLYSLILFLWGVGKVILKDPESSGTVSVAS